MPPCNHETFKIEAEITKIVDLGRWTACVTVCCAACGEAFQFLGFELGSSLITPTTSIDGTELRVPIFPANLQPPPIPKGTAVSLIATPAHDDAEGTVH